MTMKMMMTTMMIDDDRDSCDGRKAERGKKCDEGKMKELSRGGTATKKTMTVEKEQAIIFTNDFPHAGGASRTNKAVYPLFAYIVSNTGDFLLGSVFPLCVFLSSGCKLSYCKDQDTNL